MTVTAMAPTATPAAEEAPPKRSRKKLIMIVVAVLVIGGGGYQFLMPKPNTPPKPGEVVALEPIQINLGDEHYLRIGLALQLTTKAKEADGSKALDAAINLFSGLPMAEVNDPEHRTALKKELEKELFELYEKEVMGVYFTEFVTQ